MVQHFLQIALLQNDCCNRCRLGPTSLTGFGAFGTCLSPDLWATAADDLDPGLEDAAEAFFNAFWSAYTAGHLGLTDTCTHNIILSCIRQKMKEDMWHVYHIYMWRIKVHATNISKWYEP